MGEGPAAALFRNAQTAQWPDWREEGASRELEGPEPGVVIETSRKSAGGDDKQAQRAQPRSLFLGYAATSHMTTP
jgi:hypothetical protein